ncbi:class I SAM-dependent methyltransferase [Bradyrhizobium prioriisuperbiae]|uniref:class I SAM-dependent methyltransferase n=1 Tax=Bradyrhizobium prioriisuperbiae TaxID=2854389 RepID=UPI0028ED2A58|nr:class I SAM-dependent methyltransferase [Bradyrhizobium prioritasuperba]
MQDAVEKTPPTSPLASPEPWDLVADAYAAELVPQFELFATDALRIAALPAGGRVIDVATGPGTLAMLAAKTGATVSAIDFSPTMIANLNRRAVEAGTAIDARLGDGQALPFADDTYDGAFSMFGLMFFPDRAKGLQEMRRVLRPGGRAVVSSWAPFDRPFALVMESVRAMLPNLPFGEGKAPLGDPSAFADEMTAAGFREVRIESVSHSSTASSLSECWSMIQRTTAPIVLLRHKLGEQTWDKVARGVFERLQGALGEGAVTLTFNAYLGRGVK